LADGLAWNLASFSNNLDADILIEVLTLQTFKTLESVEESSSSTWNNTLITGCSGGAESILDSVFEFTNFNFR
jgi:hypothetical protein